MMFPKKKRIKDPNIFKQFHEFCLKFDLGCLYCGSRDIQGHHGIYKSQQGDDTMKNMYPLCQQCHEYVHHVGKPAYNEIKELKRKKWQILEQKFKMDLSDLLEDK